MVYYTIPFRKSVTEPVLYVKHLIEGANQVFQNSKVPIRLTLFCATEMDVEESESSDSRLDGFLNAKRNSASDTKSAVESILNSADVAILMTSTEVEKSYTIHGLFEGASFSNIGGSTFGGPSPITKKPPLAWVAAGSAVDGDDPVQPFTHEVGHLFGCFHNREEHQGGQQNKSSYGLLIEGTRYRTTMAYHTEKHDVWIPFFTNKNLKYDGLPIGDEENDNAKTLVHNRYLISLIGNESAKCSAPVTSCAGKCLLEDIAPSNLALNDTEIWCRQHCNLASTGYFNLLGKPVGITTKTLARLQRHALLFYLTLAVMVFLTVVYILTLMIGNCCSPEEKNYGKLTATANILSILGVLLNGGSLFLILLLNGHSPYGIRPVLRGVLAFSMAGVTDVGLFCALRDTQYSLYSIRGIALMVWAVAKFITAGYQAGWFFWVRVIVAC